VSPIIIWTRIKVLENEIIVLHPNAPTYYNYDIHEEENNKLSSELFKSLKRIIRVTYQKD
jgi:hypothetical protein